MDAYIPDKNFRTRDPRFATQERWKSQRTKRFGLEDFRYQEDADEYICRQGKVLRLRARKAINDGVMYRRYVAEREACEGCESTGRCIRGKVVRRRILCVPVGVVPGNLLKEMVAKVDTERGREIYHQRIGIAEPVFANSRAVKGLDRFTLRGKIKVNIQWVLYCIFTEIFGSQKLSIFKPFME